MKHLTKKCIICGKEFITKDKQSKRTYCYDDHHFKCIICGKDFIDNKLQSSHKFCSKECRNKSRSISIINTNLNRYGVTSTAKLQSTKEKYRQTCLKKYGVNNSYQIQDVVKHSHSKEAEEKRISTLLSKYGKKTCAPSFKENMLNKYGVENVSQTEKWKQNNTGINHYMNSPEARKNHPWFHQSKESINKRMNKISQTCTKKYGVPYFVMTKKCREASRTSISQLNKKWNKIICGELEFPLENKSYDIKKDNFLIEINPTYTHNVDCPPITSKYKETIDKNYHLNKTNLAKKYNYFCFHIFDWDDKQKIVSYFSEKKKIPARKCILREVSSKETNDFLEHYHFQNSCKGQIIRLGLYYNNELIQIMTFGKPRYNKNYDWELLRLCSKAGVAIIGGAEKLWKNRPEGSIISYCDISKFSGDIYKKLGFELLKTTPPTPVWSKEKAAISDNLLRQRGYDQLFNEHYGKGTSNEELMLKNGWVRVYNCGQQVFQFIPS